MAHGGRRAGPYAGAVELTAAPEAERLERDQQTGSRPQPVFEPATLTFPPWIRKLAEYDRREDHEFTCSRYG
jgi:hypothetical protein